MRRREGRRPMIRAVKSSRQVVVHWVQREVAVRSTHIKHKPVDKIYARFAGAKRFTQEQDSPIFRTHSFRGPDVSRDRSGSHAKIRPCRPRAPTLRGAPSFSSQLPSPKYPSSRVVRRCVKSCTEARRTPRHPLAATRVQRRCAQPRCRRRLVPPSVRDGSQTRNDAKRGGDAPPTLAASARRGATIAPVCLARALAPSPSLLHAQDARILCVSRARPLPQ